jgi:hypothetical protein
LLVFIFFFARFISNSAQLKKPVNLLQAQVDWSFHLNTIAIETKEGKTNKEHTKNKTKPKNGKGSFS